MPLDSAQQLTDDEYDAILMDDELYFESCLMIRTKSDGLRPLKLNSSQRYAHERIEQQRQETGRVRCLVLKGRQQGISTYVGGRYYKKVSTSNGVLAYIVTHEDAATQNLFGMTRRYHENNLPDFKPETGVANANELKFSKLDSGYKIATAGARTAGRSSTIQFLHASEFDFWPDSSAAEVWKGLAEAVPDEDGTEVIIESTADKPGGRFHRAWKAAKRGESGYMALFIPWFLHEEYRKEPTKGWVPPQSFEEYMVLHGLDMDQIYWAWDKNRAMAMLEGLGSDEFCLGFKREYPATDDEAFEEAGDELTRAIPMAWIKAAQARWIANRSVPKGPMTGLGVDVAQGGPDKTVATPCHGIRLEYPVELPGSLTTDGPSVAGMVVSVVRDNATIGIDLGGGWGGDAHTHLKKHLDMPVAGINPAAGAPGKSKHGGYEFKNMRAYLFWHFRESLNPITGDNMEIPPDDELAEDLAAATFEITRQGVLIEKKEDIKKRLGRSPDKGDSALIAWYVAEPSVRQRARDEQKKAGHSPSVSLPARKVNGRR
jgi:hypothetical protein